MRPYDAEFPSPPRLHVMHVPGADPHRDDIVAMLRSQADACVHLDPARAGVMPNWIGALKCAAATDTGGWSVIVQDDAYPLRGWQQHLERACLNSPEPILGLTHFGGYGEGAAKRGAPYGVGLNLVWGGAVAYSRMILPGLIEFADRVWQTTGYKHDDRLAAAYMLKMGLRTALASRAVFDQPVQASLIGHNTKIRRPSLTIEKPGPPYRAVPRSVHISYESTRPELERLAKL